MFETTDEFDDDEVGDPLMGLSYLERKRHMVVRGRSYVKSQPLPEPLKSFLAHDDYLRRIMGPTDEDICAGQIANQA